MMNGQVPAVTNAVETPKRTAATRVLDLLGAFARGGDALTLSEISRRANLSLPTAHRLAREVLEWGGLEIDARGRYRLSLKILDLASQSTNELRLREHAVPHLSELHRATGCTVHLVVRDGRNAMFVDSLRAYADYTGESRIGGHLPLHVTGTGLVLLAFAGTAFIEDYLSHPLKGYTSETITDPEELRVFLTDVRRNRLAVAEQCIVPGWTAVAAPVIGADGSVEASVGLVCPVEQGDPGRFGSAVRATASRISASLTEEKDPLDPRTVDFKRRHAGLL